MKGWLWPALLLAISSCGASAPLSRDDLESELRQLQSLAAEQTLFQEVVSLGHVTSAFARGHAEYLHKTIAEHAKKLGTARAEPGLEAELARARRLAAQLEHSP